MKRLAVIAVVEYTGKHFCHELI